MAGLQLGGIRFFDQIDSTNTEAALWAAQEGPDISLVLADEQIAGRGRHQRSWYTPPNSALAFSLILRLNNHSSENSGVNLEDDNATLRWTALGALAVCLALQELYAIKPEIKWPNDVLIKEQKVAGILVEAHWQVDMLQAIILGIGINIAPSSVPRDELLLYPATCVEAGVGYPVQRYELLKAIIQNIITWRQYIHSPEFIQTWDGLLAFKGQRVTILEGIPTKPTALVGTLIGLDQQGRLKLLDGQGKELRLVNGELTLRPYLENQMFECSLMNYWR